MSKKKEDIDYFKIRFYNYPYLKKRLFRIANFKGISVNTLICQLLDKGSERIDMKSELKGIEKLIFEQNQNLKYAKYIVISCTLWIIYSFYQFIYVTITDRDAPLYSGYVNFYWMNFELGILSYFAIKLIREDFISKKRIIKLVNKIGEKLVDPIEIDPLNSFEIIETKLGKIYKRKSKKEFPKAQLINEEKTIHFRFGDYILLYSQKANNIPPQV